MKTSKYQQNIIATAVISLLHHVHKKANSFFLLFNFKNCSQFPSKLFTNLHHIRQVATAINAEL